MVLSAEALFTISAIASMAKRVTAGIRFFAAKALYSSFVRSREIIKTRVLSASNRFTAVFSGAYRITGWAFGLSALKTYSSSSTIGLNDSSTTNLAVGEENLVESFFLVFCLQL